MDYVVKNAPDRRNGQPDGRRLVLRVVEGQPDVVVAGFLATGYARKVAARLKAGEITEIEAKALEASTIQEIARLTAARIIDHMDAARQGRGHPEGA